MAVRKCIMLGMNTGNRASTDFGLDTLYNDPLVPVGMKATPTANRLGAIVFVVYNVYIVGYITFLITKSQNKTPQPCATRL